MFVPIRQQGHHQWPYFVVCDPGELKGCSSCPKTEAGTRWGAGMLTMPCESKVAERRALKVLRHCVCSAPSHIGHTPQDRRGLSLQPAQCPAKHAVGVISAAVRYLCVYKATMEQSFAISWLLFSARRVRAGGARQLCACAHPRQLTCAS